MRQRIVWLAVAAIAVPAIAGAQALRYLNPQDVREAQQEHAALVQELGGAETGPRAAYVDSVGHRVAAFAGVADPGRAFRFTTLNSSAQNAFSVPGGYVYVTRQLLTILDDESQLAFAIGHEVGHVAGNHAHIREQYVRSNRLGVLGAIISSVFGDSSFGGLLQQRARLDTLSFSREQEYEADTLGLSYITRAGYDPAGAPGILAALTRASALEARVQGRTNRRTPEWASTHPLSENRLQRALLEARQTGRLGRGVRNRDQFLSQLEGVTVDDDPAQGIIDGPVFTHPDLRIQFQVPPGYLMSNSTEAVTISGSAGKAQFSGGTYPGTLDSYILSAFRALTGGQSQIAIPAPRHFVITGMPAAVTAARAETDSGVMDVSIAAYQADPRHVYHFLMITPGGYGFGAFASMVNSLRRITPAEAAAIRPRIIHVVTVGAGDTVQSLAGRMAYRDFRLERFLSLNGLNATSRLAPGQRVKLVVFGPRRS
jgi:predicted Zn-dependent protease